jgi:hypothetical protein
MSGPPVPGTHSIVTDWAQLIVQAGNGKAFFLLSKEGVTPGGPLLMVAYSLVTLPPPHPLLAG